jgi:hypothetical protein
MRRQPDIIDALWIVAIAFALAQVLLNRRFIDGASLW